MNIPYVKQYSENGELIKPDFPIISGHSNRYVRAKRINSVANDANKLIITPKINENGRFIGYKKMRTSLQIVPDHVDSDGDTIVGKRILHYK